MSTAILKDVVAACLGQQVQEYEIYEGAVSYISLYRKMPNRSTRHITDMFINDDTGLSLILTCSKVVFNQSPNSLVNRGLEDAFRYISEKESSTRTFRYKVNCDFSDPSLIEQVTNFISFANKIVSL